jgi:hypothetical protein
MLQVQAVILAKSPSTKTGADYMCILTQINTPHQLLAGKL